MSSSGGAKCLVLAFADQTPTRTDVCDSVGPNGDGLYSKAQDFISIPLGDNQEDVVKLWSR